jgi:hypothetical protein
MRDFAFRATIVALLAGGAAANAADLPSPAAPPPPAPVIAPSGWQFTATLPAWATWLDGSVGVGRLPSANANASFGTLLAHLKGILAGTFIAHDETFILGLDFLWSRVGANVDFKSNGVGPFANLRAGTSAALTQDMAFATAFGGYRIPIGTPDLHLYGTVGARYSYMGININLTHQFANTASLQPVGFSLVSSQSISWVDPVVGFAAHYRINDKWFVDAYGDIGGFGVSSKVTSLGEIAVGYNWTQSIATSLGFKYLYDDYQRNNSNNGSFRYNATLYGPVANLSYTF